VLDDLHAWLTSRFGNGSYAILSDNWEGYLDAAARNVLGMSSRSGAHGTDNLLRATRITLIPVVAISVFLALRVPQTGILPTLAFDVILAAPVVPFVFGHYWARANTAAAIAAITVGSILRLGFFVLTPTIYGVPNTLLYIPNSVVGAGFDGWATVVAAMGSLVAFVTVTMADPPATRAEAPVESRPAQDSGAVSVSGRHRS